MNVPLDQAIKAIAALLRVPSPISAPVRASAAACSVSERDLARSLPELFDAATAAGDIPRSAAIVLVAVEHFRIEALHSTTFGGALRPSAHRGRAGILSLSLSLAARLLERADDAIVCARLLSLSSYATIAVEVESRERRLLHRMSQVPDALYWLLALAEDSFVHYDERRRDYTPPSGRSQTAEATAAVVSYLFNLAARQGRLPGDWYVQRRRDVLTPPRPLRGIAAEGYDLLHLRELEPYVIHYGYVCRSLGNGRFDVVSPEPEIGRGLDSGEIDTALALQRPVAGVRRTTLRELGDGLSATYGERLFEWVARGDRQSLRMKLDGAMLGALRESVLSQDALYHEQFHDIMTVARESFVDADELLRHEVADGLTVASLSKFARLFFLLWSARRAKLLETTRGADPGLYWRSLLVAIPSETFRPLAEALPWWTVDAQRGFLSLFSSAADTARLDLQYSPMLEAPAPRSTSSDAREFEGENGIAEAAGVVFCVAPTLMAYSLSTRNALRTSGTRPSSDGSDDRLVAGLEAALKLHFPRTKSDWRYRHAAGNGDVDVLVASGKYLFVLECKRTLWPSGGYEMRTQWDYLDKAARQLERFSVAWKDHAFRQKMETSLGWELSAVESVVTGIITTSRYMAGFEFRGHPVRQSGQAINVLGDGRMLLGVSDSTVSASLAPQEFDLRGGLPVTDSFLAQYLSREWALSDCMRRSLKPTVLRYRAGSCAVEWHRSHLDLDTLLESVAGAFQSVEDECAP